MRAVIQRTTNAHVMVENEIVGEINHGLVVLIGVTHDDTLEDVQYLANKIVHLRIFEDDDQKMNLSVKDVAGSILSISQFTLYGDTSKGRRPNFMQAAPPSYANELYEAFNAHIIDHGINVKTGQFGKMMDVEFTNAGPVTLILDSKESL